MRVRPLSVVFALLASTFVITPPAVAAPRTVVKEVFSPDGTISRVRVAEPPSEPAPLSAVAAEVVPIQETGPSSSRFDLVFVGDGYTASQMATYHQHVVNRWNELTQIEPYRSLKQSFNVWQ